MLSPTFRPLILLAGAVLLLHAASRPARAEEPVPPRVGRDAPHEERNPAERSPAAYQIKRSAGTTTPAPAAAPAGVADQNSAPKKRRKVPVKRALPVGPTAEELAAERREWERAPMRVGNDAPHYERNGSSERRATRLIVIER